MPLAAIEARMAQIESSLQALSPQRSLAVGAGLPGGATTAGVSGAGGIIGSTTGGLPGAGTAAATDGFSAALEEALGTATGSDAPSASDAASSADATGSAGASRGTAAGTAFGASIVETAEKYLGTPYVWGGNSPSQGFDCSGLVKYVMKELGVDMPRVARAQAKVGTEVTSLAEAQPGDLLGMRNGSHIAIYLGDNKILHAPQPGENVSIRSLFSWDDIDTIRRVAPAGGSGSASQSGSTRAAFEQLAGASA
ncbi:C40 family peptidase [Citricoccus sp.]|uniref:C40 family peptidase n=1 Tax=Citricoccus sp. TaxID=1978372 RepID=UPI0028BD67C1|nr:C40 family peptidase [Citricoccus sp.]